MDIYVLCMLCIALIGAGVESANKVNEGEGASAAGCLIRAAMLVVAIVFQGMAL